MRGRAYAKINLGLRVGQRRDDGLHPIESLIQSIGWADEMQLEPSEADGFDIVGGDLPAGDDNLAWRAVEALRRPGDTPIHLTLQKSVAVAAGLGGGSADAALGLALAASTFGRDPAIAVGEAPSLGSDVPFCLAGGLARVRGSGDEVELLPLTADYAVAIVVPPFELGTADVYRVWDELGGPTGPEFGRRHLPVSLRDHAPLVNDLQPAAIAIDERLGDWIADVAGVWGQPALMSGSGPSLFSLFGSVEEAEEAARAVPDVRDAVGVAPHPVGWEIDDGPLPPAPWISH